MHLFAQIPSLCQRPNQSTVYLFFKSKQSQDAYCLKATITADRRVALLSETNRCAHDMPVQEGFHKTEHLFDQQ